MVEQGETQEPKVRIVIESRQFAMAGGYPPVWTDEVRCESYEVVGAELVLTNGRVRRQHGSERPLMPWGFQERVYQLREVSTYTVIEGQETQA